MKAVTIPLDVMNAIEREAARDPSDPTRAPGFYSSANIGSAASALSIPTRSFLSSLS